MEPAATVVVLGLHRVMALVIGGAFVVGVHLPPGHCHPSNDRHPAVVHRHASPHVLRHTAQTLADDDGLIIWSDGSYLAGTVTPAGADPRVARPAACPSLLEGALSSVPAFAPAPPSRVHDPPRRAPGSRAPPISSAV